LHLILFYHLIAGLLRKREADPPATSRLAWRARC
jgi:hypothetical protein